MYDFCSFVLSPFCVSSRCCLVLLIGRLGVVLSPQPCIVICSDWLWLKHSNVKNRFWRTLRASKINFADATRTVLNKTVSAFHFFFLLFFYLSCLRCVLFCLFPFANFAFFFFFFSAVFSDFFFFFPWWLSAVNLIRRFLIMFLSYFFVNMAIECDRCVFWCFWWMFFFVRAAGRSR